MIELSCCRGSRTARKGSSRSTSNKPQVSPCAFALLVLSKVYLVTKGALVPLMISTDAPSPPADDRPDDPSTRVDPSRGARVSAIVLTS